MFFFKSRRIAAYRYATVSYNKTNKPGHTFVDILESCQHFLITDITDVNLFMFHPYSLTLALSTVNTNVYFGFP